jgi:hypothetical protein
MWVFWSPFWRFVLRVRGECSWAEVELVLLAVFLRCSLNGV